MLQVNAMLNRICEVTKEWPAGFFTSSCHFFLCSSVLVSSQKIPFLFSDDAGDLRRGKGDPTLAQSHRWQGGANEGCSDTAGGEISTSQCWKLQRSSHENVNRFVLWKVTWWGSFTSSTFFQTATRSLRDQGIHPSSQRSLTVGWKLSSSPGEDQIRSGEWYLRERALVEYRQQAVHGHAQGLPHGAEGQSDLQHAAHHLRRKNQTRMDSNSPLCLSQECKGLRNFVLCAGSSFCGKCAIVLTFDLLFVKFLVICVTCATLTINSFNIV